MGAVWLGRDDVLGRQVAIKRIGMAPGGSSPDLLRAEREARLAARLNHPHVVAVFDLVDEDDQQWLVMEYVEGSTLAELVRSNGALHPDQAAQIIVQAAEAIMAEGAAGVVIAARPGRASVVMTSLRAAPRAWRSLAMDQSTIVSRIAGSRASPWAACVCCARKEASSAATIAAAAWAAKGRACAAVTVGPNRAL